MVESPTYNFSTSLSTSLAQPLGIRFLGMDVTGLGVLTSIQLGFVGLGAFFGDLIINKYRFNRKAFWTIFGAINRVGWASIILTTIFPGETRIPIFYILVAISQFSGAVAGIAAGDIGGDLVDRERAPRFFGFLNSINNVAALASLIISTVLFILAGGGSYYAYLLLYIISLVSAMISTIFLIMIKDDPEVVRVFKTSLIKYRSTSLNIYRELLLGINTKNYVLVTVLYTASVNIPASLWNYYLIYGIGGDETWITAKTATTYMVKAIMLHIWPIYIQRYGIRRVFIVSLTAISPIPLIFMLARSFTLQIMLEIYSAIWWSSWDLCSGLYNLYLLPREKRASMLAVITLVTNMSASISSLTGSVIASALSPYGVETSFIISSLSRLMIALTAYRSMPSLNLRS